MEAQDCYFEVRWTTEIGSLEFHAQMVAQGYSDLVRQVDTLSTHSDVKVLQEPLRITAAEFCFDTKNKATGRYECLDDDYSGLLECIVKETLSEGSSPVQHYMNARMGGYDKFNNRILPVDLGITFPDGTVRLWWDEAECKLGFDDAYAFYSTALSTLLAMARTPYFQETDDEINADDRTSYQKRRIDFLFAQGLWPDDENEFGKIATLDDIEKALEQFVVPEPA